MLTQPTIEKLCTMRLRGMAEAFQQQQQDANIHGLRVDARLTSQIFTGWVQWCNSIAAIPCRV